MKRRRKPYSVHDDVPPVPEDVCSHVFTSTADRWLKLRGFAQENRKNPSKAENVLWQELRNKTLGYKFRRQHAFDFLIVDFVCIEKRLVIEVDGDTHSIPEQIALDEERTSYLNYLGYEVIRFSNEEVLSSMKAVLNVINSQLQKIPSLKTNLSPLPRRGGKG